jgi:nitroreductase
MSNTESLLFAQSALAGMIERRRSIRRFLDEPVPREVLGKLLRAARQAPSGANLQPGSFIQVTGAARVRLSAVLVDAYRAGETETEDYSYFPDPLPHALKRRQVMAAKALYETLGIARNDSARAAYFERNFRFFDAPIALVVTMGGRLGSGCYMDLGMCLYGLMLAAVAEGLGSCAIGALASYPSLIRRTLGLDPGQHIVCGFAIGRPDGTAPENDFRTDRLPLEGYLSVIERPSSQALDDDR